MLNYLMKRVCRSFLTLFIVITAVFILLRQMPVEGYFENIDKLTETQIEVGLRELGLKDPMHIQVMNFYKKMFQGDLGVSRKYRVNIPVTEILAPKIPISVKLGVVSLLVSLLIGLPMGILMARNKGKFFDKVGTLFIVLIQAVPAAVYYLFINLYGTQLLNVPLAKFDINQVKYWILPVFSMALGNIAYYGMWLRRYMVDESTKDYVRLATAKGLSKNKAMFQHVFRNACVPLIQYLPTSFMNTVIGSIYIEALYSIPGMGGLLVTVVKSNDNNMVQAIVILYATVGVIGLLIGDVLMTILDPRISFGKKEGGR